MNSTAKSAKDGNGSDTPPPAHTKQRQPRSSTRRLWRFTWRFALRPLVVLAVLIFVILVARSAFFRLRAVTMTEVEKLAEDRMRLARILLLEHPTPFRIHGRDRVEMALGRAAGAVDSFAAGTQTKEQVLASFAEAVASLGDPHTTFSDRYDHFGILPVAFGIFDGEVRLLSTPPADAALLGSRVTALDDTPIDVALTAIRRVVPHATESGLRATAPGYLRAPGLLAHVGIMVRPHELRIGLLRNDGTPASLEVPRLTLEEYLEHPPRRFETPEDALPLYRRQDARPYWVHALPERDAVYIRMAQATLLPNTPIESLAAEALRLQEELDLTHVVVDLRGNRGGDPQAHVGLVRVLAAASDGREPDFLRVLVDGVTFSAAIAAASDLERRAGGMLVGEEPGDIAHSTTDPRPFTLWHSDFEVWVPTSLMGTPGGADGRARLQPRRPFTPTFDDWATGSDRALDAALAPGTAGALDATSQVVPSALATATPLPTGRWIFDRQRALTVTHGPPQPGVSVTGYAASRLVALPDRSWSAAPGLRLRTTGGGDLELRTWDGTWTALEPLGSRLAPLELALAGRVEESREAYRALTADGTDRAAVAGLGIVMEAFFRYAADDPDGGSALFRLAGELSPADPLIPLQHSLLRKEAEDRWLPPLSHVIDATGACLRRYRTAAVWNDWRLCL